MRRVQERLARLRERSAALWWARTTRERWLLALGGGLVLATVPYTLIWEPLAERVSELEAEVADKREDLAWMREAAEEIQAHGDGAAPAEPVTDDRSLLSLIDRSAREAGIDDALSRVQPEDGGTVRVWMDAAPFDPVIEWLAHLQRTAGVRVSALTAEDADGPGRADIRLTLEVNE